MSIFDDISDAFKKAVDGIIEGTGYVLDGVTIAFDTVKGAISAAAKATAEWVEGAAFVVVREVENAAGEVAKGADTVWTRIRGLVEPGKPELPSLAAGERVREKDGKVYLLLDGKLRYIPDRETYNDLFKDWNGITEIERASAYPVGTPITSGAYIASGSPDGRVFLIVDGQKRWIITEHVFDRYAFNRTTVRALAPEKLAAIPEGAPISGEYIPNGRRVLDRKSGAIFLMIDDRLRHIPNPATYDNLFRDWSGIGDLGNLVGQARGEPLADGAYLASGTPDGKVFLILDNSKRWVAGPPVMDRYHFKWNAVRKLSAEQLAAMPDGPTLD